MKKLAAILCLAALTTCAFAQGTINFVNASGPQVRYDVNGIGTGQPLTSYSLLPTGAAGTYYFALLTANLGTTDPTAFSLAVYGTNLSAAGILRGASSVNGWVTGTSRSFEVAGWDLATGGGTFNSAWLTDPASRPHYFGMTVIGSGFAGGVDPVTGGPIPALNIFGGNGVPTTSAFVLYQVPEPATMALAGLGAAALLIFRRRK
jgi:hypothetical protein